MKNTENNSSEFVHPIFGLTARERQITTPRQIDINPNSEWQQLWHKYSFHITLGASIFLLSVAIFAVTEFFGLTDIAHAATMQPEDVHTLEAACDYAGLYPEQIKNLDDLQIACADNGTPVQFMDPNWNKKV